MGLFKKYKVIGNFNDEYKIVSMKDKSGQRLMDKEGKLSEFYAYNITPSKSYLSQFVKLTVSDKYAFLTPEGELLPGRYVGVKFFSDSYASEVVVTFEDGSQTYVDGQGKEFPYIFNTAYGFQDNGFARVIMNDKDSSETYVYLNHDNSFYTDKARLSRFRFLKAGPFKNGFACVQLKDERWTYMTEDQKLLDGRFYEVKPFENGYAKVKTSKDFDRSWTFINEKGEIIPERFYSMNPSSKEGEYNCRLDEGCYLLFRNGKIVDKSWVDVLRNHPDCFELLPTERFRDEKFITRCIDAIKTQLKSDASKKKELTQDDIDYTNALYKMIELKIAKEQEKIAAEDVKKEEAALIQIQKEKEARAVKEAQIKAGIKKAKEQKENRSKIVKILNDMEKLGK